MNTSHTLLEKCIRKCSLHNSDLPLSFTTGWWDQPAQSAGREPEAADGGSGWGEWVRLKSSNTEQKTLALCNVWCHTPSHNALSAMHLKLNKEVAMTENETVLPTLLQIKVLQAMPLNNHFWFHKEPFSQRFFKEPSLSYLFNNLKNILSPQRTVCETERFCGC